MEIDRADDVSPARIRGGAILRSSFAESSGQGVASVAVGVDDPGEDVVPGCIDGAPCGRRLLASQSDPGDPFPVDADRAVPEYATRRIHRDHGSTSDE